MFEVWDGKWLLALMLTVLFGPPVIMFLNIKVLAIPFLAIAPFGLGAFIFTTTSDYDLFTRSGQRTYVVTIVTLVAAPLLIDVGILLFCLLLP